MKTKKAKHSKESIFENKKFIIIIAIIGIAVTFVSLYMGKAKFKFKGEDIRVQNTSGEFHFYSSILSAQNKEYSLHDWDGEEYLLNIDLENFIDSLRNTNENISYTVTATTTDGDKVGIVIDSENTTLQQGTNVVEGNNIEISKTGILEVSERRECFDVVLNKVPNVDIADGDFITVNINVSSTVPYTKSLSATFKIFKQTREEFSLKYTENADKRIGYLTIDTHVLTEPVTFQYDSAKLILNKTSECLQGANITTDENGIVSVSVELENNKIYNLNFMKIDDSTANVW